MALGCIALLHFGVVIVWSLLHYAKISLLARVVSAGTSASVMAQSCPSLHERGSFAAHRVQNRTQVLVRAMGVNERERKQPIAMVHERCRNEVRLHGRGFTSPFGPTLREWEKRHPTICF